MSLTFPSTRHSQKENWLYIFYSDTAGSTVVTRLANSDTTIDGDEFEGVVLNKPNIRDTISLEESKAKTSNISLSIVNAKIEEKYLSEAIFGHDRVCINKRVKVYSQINDASALSDCVQIYDGRLISVDEGIDKLKLTIVAYRPFENISAGNQKSGSIYVPVSYGDYSANTGSDFDNLDFSHIIRDNFTSYNYRKIPYLVSFGGNSYFSTGSIRDLSSGSRPAFYDASLDAFIPIYPADDVTDAVVVDSVTNYCANAADNQQRSFIVFPGSVAAGSLSSGVTVDGSYPLSNIIDLDALTSAHAEIDMVLTGSGTKTATIDFGIDQPDGKLSKIKSFTRAYYVKNSGTGIPTTITIGGAGLNTHTLQTSATSHAGSEVTASYDTTPSIFINFVNGGAMNITVIIYYFGYYSEFETDLNQDRNIIWGYSAADGVTESYTGGNTSTTLSIGPKIHRDILARFTDYNVVDGSIVNWSGIISDKSAWTMRINLIEPMEIEKLLNKIQYESGFIFTRSMAGLGKYIYLENSYSSGDVAYTISKNDISSMSVKHRRLKDVTTQMEIDSDPHPGKGTYRTRSTSTNAVTQSNLFGSSTNENIKTIQLDYLYAPIIDSADPRTDNTNSSFAAYYNKIIGDIYPSVSFKLHNPEMYGIEVGDIIQFSDLANSKPLGDRWTDQYYMVTSVQRSIGTLNIEAYWVYGVDPTPLVTYPDGGETLYTGYTHNLLWDWNVQSERNAKVTLYKGGSSDSVLSAATPNDGTYAHAIATNETAASDYKIRVESADSSAIYDESDANFTIATTALSVTGPAADSAHEPSSTLEIRWSFTGPSGGSIKLELWKATSVNTVISTGTTNDGVYDWTIPGGQATDDDYKIRAYDTSSTSGTTIYDDNYHFKVIR